MNHPSHTLQKFRTANSHYRHTPASTQAVVLTTGPGIQAYQPANHPQATTYGVNDIFTQHPVQHLVTLDNPWQWHTHTLHNELHAHRQKQTIALSNPKFWHFWKDTGNEGIKDHPGYTLTPLSQYSGKNLFGPVCPKWYCSAFVACALAARHGHTQIITYGIHWYGHPVQEPMIPHQTQGFAMLAKEMAANGITLYTSSAQSALAKFLPVWQG